MHTSTPTFVRSRRVIAASTLIASFGFVVAASLAVGSAPASATNEFPGPNATLTVGAGCDGSTFVYTFTLSNPNGAGTAHFYVDAADQSFGLTSGLDVAPNEKTPISLNIWQGNVGHVHVTSSDATPAIDFSVSLTNECPPDATTTTSTTSTTAVPTTTLPPAVTTIVDSGSNLPETGSTSAGTIAAAFAALLAGVALIRVARRAA